jgi:hypothetical protein
VAIRELAISSPTGSAIYVTGEDSIGPTVALTNVVLRRSQRGVFQEAGAVAIHGGSITDSIAEGVASTNGTLQIDGQATISHNEEGIVIGIGSTAAIAHALVSDHSGGGLIVVEGGTASVTSSTFRSNLDVGVAVDAGTLTVTNSTLEANAWGATASAGSFTLVNSIITRNSEGGITIADETSAAVLVARIIGNAITYNGNAASDAGHGLQIFRPSTQSVFEFNTIAFNGSADLPREGSGIECVSPAPVGAIRNSIVTMNVGAQIGSLCRVTYSVVFPGTATGSGVLVADPRFVDVDRGDLRLQAMSRANCAADPATVLNELSATDLDGHARLLPADLGAYARAADVTCPAPSARSLRWPAPWAPLGLARPTPRCGTRDRSCAAQPGSPRRAAQKMRR